MNHDHDCILRSTLGNFSPKNLTGGLGIILPQSWKSASRYCCYHYHCYHYSDFSLVYQVVDNDVASNPPSSGSLSFSPFSPNASCYQREAYLSFIAIRSNKNELLADAFLPKGHLLSLFNAIAPVIRLRCWISVRLWCTEVPLFVCLNEVYEAGDMTGG